MEYGVSRQEQFLSNRQRYQPISLPQTLSDVTVHPLPDFTPTQPHSPKACPIGNRLDSSVEGVHGNPT